MDDRLDIGEEQVAALIGEQFPQWADLPVRRLMPGGWNNRSFRLGDTMTVRMPSASRYVAQVAKEQRYLPFLANHLPLPITPAIAMGKPGAGYPFAFGVYGWIEGERADEGEIRDRSEFARSLAVFLGALQAVDARQGPASGIHNFFRGGDLSIYDQETRVAITALADEIDVARVAAVWDIALESFWQREPVWVHGDIAAGNLLVNDGRLHAVIDFGSMGVGDPACDLVIAWTFLDPQSRSVFREALPHDAKTWQRARGWALWKALITLEARRRDDPAGAARARAEISAILSDAGRE